MPMQRFNPALPADYPVTWDHNDDGHLQVTITLAELRPHPPWRHTGDDVVLVLRNTSLSEVTVTYTVTALGMVSASAVSRAASSSRCCATCSAQRDAAKPACLLVSE